MLRAIDIMCESGAVWVRSLMTYGNSTNTAIGITKYKLLMTLVGRSIIINHIQLPRIDSMLMGAAADTPSREQHRFTRGWIDRFQS
jgi:hypothetical protein